MRKFAHQCKWFFSLCWLELIGLALTIGFFTGFILFQQSEISDYRMVEKHLKKAPEIQPFVKECLEDGMISYYEEHLIFIESMDIQSRQRKERAKYLDNVQEAFERAEREVSKKTILELNE